MELLNLDTVDLYIVDYRTDSKKFEKSLYAFDKTREQVNFRSSVFITSSKNKNLLEKRYGKEDRVRFYYNYFSENITNMVEYSMNFVRDACLAKVSEDERWNRVKNSTHVLFIQWDGFVLNSEKWTNDFLNYDYIGAPWFFKQKELYQKVGNGGFSLRSHRLIDICHRTRIKMLTNCLKWIENQKTLLEFSKAEDNVICIANREYLENEWKIKFAPFEIARKFSTETEPYVNSFGWHGMFFKETLPKNKVKYFGE